MKTPKNLLFPVAAAALAVALQCCCPRSSWAQSPHSNAVFVSRNPSGANEVGAFVQDPGTGALSLVGTYLTGGRGELDIDGNQSHALAVKDDLLFVTNTGDNSLTVFRIESTGALSRLQRVSSRGVRPVSLAVKDTTLLVVNQGITAGKPGAVGGNVTAFSIGNDGELAHIRGSTFSFHASDTPNEILSNSANRLFSVGRSSANAVDTFRLSADGRISRTDTQRGVQDPLGGAIKSGSRSTVIFTLPDRSHAGVMSLVVNAQGKFLNARTYLRPKLLDPCWATIHPNGTLVWTAAFATRTISLYRLGERGGLTAVSNFRPWNTGAGIVDLTTDSTGSYVFQLRAFRAPGGEHNQRPSVAVFETTGGDADAGLALVGEYDLPSSWSRSGPTGIAVAEIL